MFIAKDFVSIIVYNNLECLFDDMRNEGLSYEEMFVILDDAANVLNQGVEEIKYTMNELLSFRRKLEEDINRVCDKME